MPELLKLHQIRKTFPGVVALDAVSLTVKRGEIHTLLGENGAGKSTLMNILTGFYAPDRGQISLAGQAVHFTSPADSLAQGIGMVHQHFMLIPAHSVLENILVALQDVPSFLPQHRLREKIRRTIADFGLDLDLDMPVWKLSIGAQQWIELLKLLMRNCQLLILDEPTAVLTPQETEKLFGVLQKLKDQGKSIIFISHKMREVMEISDRVTILKKGRSLTTLAREDFDQQRLAALMIGGDKIPEWQKSLPFSEELVLEIENLGVRNERGRTDLDNFNLQLKKGEILGIAGIAGNGQKALAEALTGLVKIERGRVLAAGHDMTHSCARSSYIAGIAHIPEDRKAIGIAPDLSLDENLILKSFRAARFRCGFFQSRGAIRRNAEEKIGQFAIKAGPPGSPVRLLSGGNIQKVIIARELSERPAVLVALYPTRGLDMGSAEYVHKVIVDGAGHGMSTILISEDLDELYKICDRVAVIFRGRLVGYADPANTSRQQIGLMMSGEAPA